MDSLKQRHLYCLYPMQTSPLRYNLLFGPCSIPFPTKVISVFFERMLSFLENVFRYTECVLIRKHPQEIYMWGKRM
jgi:hypothetical protein